MKRYRLFNLFIDGTRALFNDPKIPGEIVQQEREETRKYLAAKYGVLDLDDKLKRFLEFTPPNICILFEHLQLIQETADSYVSGNYYPAVTAACCLGERTFNALILRLRHYYKHHVLYKEVHDKEFIQDWELAIRVLAEWGVINSDIKKEYKQLQVIRHNSIHLKHLSNLPDRALTALKSIMYITDKLFGLKSDAFFWTPGELYIQKDKEKSPIVKEFFIPNCRLVGYKHSVSNAGVSGQLVLKYEDAYTYGNREITDDEFRQLRIKWQKQQADKQNSKSN